MLAQAKKKKTKSELDKALWKKLYALFLHKKTQGFIDQFFVACETKSYLPSNPEPLSPKVESAATSAATEQASTQVVIPPVDTVPVQPHPIPVLSVSSTDSRAKNSASDSTKRRSRSRSRSQERDRDQTAHHSKSRDHRGGRESNNRKTNRSRSRSPLPHSSPNPRGPRRGHPPIAPPPVVAELDEVVGAPGLDLPPVGAPAAPAAPIILANRFRCQDFEKTGRCMRPTGLCPFEHGNVPPNLVHYALLNINRPQHP